MAVSVLAAIKEEKAEKPFEEYEIQWNFFIVAPLENKIGLCRGVLSLQRNILYYKSTFGSQRSVLNRESVLISGVAFMMIC